MKIRNKNKTNNKMFLKLLTASCYSLLVLAGCGLVSESEPETRNKSNFKTSTEKNGSGANDSKKDPSSPAQAGLALTYDQAIKPLIDKHCLPCHENAIAGSQNAFQLSSYGPAHGLPGVSSILDDFKTVLANGSMPKEGYKFSDDELQLMNRWLDSGAPESKVPDPAVGKATNQIVKLLAPVAKDETPVSKVFDIYVSLTNFSNTAIWSAYYSRTPNSVSGGTLIKAGTPGSTNKISWDTSKVDAGSYYVYVEVLDKGKRESVSSGGGSVLINNSVVVPEKVIVPFHIADGTGPGPWNTKASMVRVKLGNILRIYNDDKSVPGHQMHTGGAPCGHQPTVIKVGEYFDCVISKPIDPTSLTSPNTYSHIYGKVKAPFWLFAD